MYSLKEKVFIAWGGNQDLAKKLSENLSQQKFDNYVGGDADHKAEGIEFVSARVFSQMRNSSRAIILAEGKPKSDGTFEFRPNLMFEWGYLLGRLPQGSLTVVFINTPREKVPSDLQGVFSLEVPSHLTEAPRQARWIAEKFIETRLEDRYHPIDTIYNWTKAKVFLESQIDKTSAPNPELFEKYLVTSFIPAVYSGDLDFLSNIVSEVRKNFLSAKSPYVELTRCILRYIEMTQSSKKPTINELQELKRRISRCVDSGDPYVRSITRHFMGRCLQKMAYASTSPRKRLEFVAYAKSAFEKAVKEMLNSGLDEQSQALWLSFLYRHLSRCCETLGTNDSSECSNAVAYAKRSIKEREYMTMQFSEVPNSRFSEAFLAEYYLAVIDYVRLTHEFGFTPFKELADLSLNVRARSSVWWAKVDRDYRAMIVEKNKSIAASRKNNKPRSRRRI